MLSQKCLTKIFAVKKETPLHTAHQCTTILKVLVYTSGSKTSGSPVSSCQDKDKSTHTCSRGCSWWAGSLVCTRMRCLLLELPGRYEHSRGFCPYKWGLPLSRSYALQKQTETLETDMWCEAFGKSKCHFITMGWGLASVTTLKANVTQVANIQSVVISYKYRTVKLNIQKSFANFTEHMNSHHTSGETDSVRLSEVEPFALVQWENRRQSVAWG